MLQAIIDGLGLLVQIHALNQPVGCYDLVIPYTPSTRYATFAAMPSLKTQLTERSQFHVISERDQKEDQQIVIRVKEGIIEERAAG